MKNTLLIIFGSIGVIAFFYWMKSNTEKALSPKINPLNDFGFRYSKGEEPIITDEPEPDFYPAYLWSTNGKIVLSIEPETCDEAGINQGDLIIIDDENEDHSNDPVQIVTKVKGIFPSNCQAKESFNLFTSRKEDGTFINGNVTISKLNT